MLIYISYLKYKKNRIKLLPLRFVTYSKEQTNTEQVESHQGITETHRADINSSTNKDYLSAMETWGTQHVASRPAQSNLFNQF